MTSPVKLDWSCPKSFTFLNSLNFVSLSLSSSNSPKRSSIPYNLSLLPSVSSVITASPKLDLQGKKKIIEVARDSWIFYLTDKLLSFASAFNFGINKVEKFGRFL